MKYRKICVILLLILCSLFIIYIHYTTAQTTNKEIKKETSAEKFEYEKPEKVESPSYFVLLLKTLLILVIFGGGVYYIFKYISRKQGFVPLSSNIIKLISTVPVGTNRFVQLIEVGTHYYLIGSTESGISLISEITDNESINMIKIQQNKIKPMQPKVTFVQFLKDLIGHIPKKEGKTEKSGRGFLKRQKERLKNLNNKV